MGRSAFIGLAARRVLPTTVALLCLTATAFADDGPFGTLAPGLSAPPTLRADTAIYNLDQGVLQYAFTFVNPSDSVLFLDCQVPPRATLAGSTLVLEFDRTALPPATGSADSPDASSATAPSPGAPPAGAQAGGPVAGSVNPEDFPPQRIGARQTFQGQRKLDRVLGDYQARPKFSSLELRMAFYPESSAGEGAPFVSERKQRTAAVAIKVVRKGKTPTPPRVLKPRNPAVR